MAQRRQGDVIGRTSYSCFTVRWRYRGHGTLCICCPAGCCFMGCAKAARRRGRRLLLLLLPRWLLHCATQVQLVCWQAGALPRSHPLVQRVQSPSEQRQRRVCPLLRCQLGSVGRAPAAFPPAPLTMPRLGCGRQLLTSRRVRLYLRLLPAAAERLGVAAATRPTAARCPAALVGNLGACCCNWCVVPVPLNHQRGGVQEQAAIGDDLSAQHDVVGPELCSSHPTVVPGCQVFKYGVSGGCLLILRATPLCCAVLVCIASRACFCGSTPFLRPVQASGALLAPRTRTLLNGVTPLRGPAAAMGRASPLLSSRR